MVTTVGHSVEQVSQRNSSVLVVPFFRREGSDQMELQGKGVGGGGVGWGGSDLFLSTPFEHLLPPCLGVCLMFSVVSPSQVFHSSLQTRESRCVCSYTPVC